MGGLTACTYPVLHSCLVMKALLKRSLCSVETDERVARNLRFTSLFLFGLTLAFLVSCAGLALVGVEISGHSLIVLVPVVGAASAAASMLFRWRLVAVLFLLLNLTLFIVLLPTLKPIKRRPNPAASVDAPITRDFVSQSQWRRATDQRC